VAAIEALGEKPIIMGHSFGGLLTQLMVQRGLASAAVAIDSVAPQGVLPFEWSFIRSTFPIVNPFIPASRPWYMSLEQFSYAFVNDLPAAEQKAVYDREVVPESRRLGRGGLTSAARIDFRRPHAPLLLIAGEKDHIMPASLNRRNFEKYRKGSTSVTDFKLFMGRAHYSILSGPRWQEVADYALDWTIRAVPSHAQDVAPANPNGSAQPVARPAAVPAR
jgi:pimeloyl-ACP methyl ester carboxylesterase